MSSSLTKLFKKYMRVEDETKAHAVLSASGSERWLGCPAAPSLSEGKPQVVHPSAQIGVNAHTLLQFILENPKNWQALLADEASIKFRRHIDFVSHQLRNVMIAVNFVYAEMARMEKATGIKPELYIEKKVILKGVGFGRADVILYQPFGLLHVVDYKNGKFGVSPEDNSQGLYYGVAAADEFGWDFSRAAITIIQPNGKGAAIQTWKTTPERLEKAKLMFTRGAARTRSEKPAVIPNHKYCWFCPARVSCPAHVKQRHVKIMSKFDRSANHGD